MSLCWDWDGNLCVDRFYRAPLCGANKSGSTVYTLQYTTLILLWWHHSGSGVIIDMDGFHIPLHSQQTGQSNVELDQRQFQVKLIENQEIIDPDNTLCKNDRPRDDGTLRLM